MAGVERCWSAGAAGLRVTACSTVTCGATFTAQRCGAESTTPEEFVKSSQGLLMRHPKSFVRRFAA